MANKHIPIDGDKHFPKPPRVWGATYSPVVTPLKDALERMCRMGGSVAKQYIPKKK